MEFLIITVQTLGGGLSWPAGFEPGLLWGAGALAVPAAAAIVQRPRALHPVAFTVSEWSRFALDQVGRPPDQTATLDARQLYAWWV